MNAYWPYAVFVCLATWSSEVTTTIGTAGRYFDARLARNPSSLNTTMQPSAAPRSTAVFAAQDTTASIDPTGIGVKSRMKL